jgi:hypothetical protein
VQDHPIHRTTSVPADEVIEIPGPMANIHAAT